MKPSANAPTPEMLLSRAHAEFAAGADSAALATASAALALRPAWPPALLLQANAGLRSGALDTAIAALQMLCQSAAPSPPLLNALATALNNRGSRSRRTGDEAAALGDFEAALSCAPTHALAGFNRALCLLALGRSEDAERALRQHLAAHPQDLEAQLELCLLQPESATRTAAIGELLARPGARELPAELRLRAERAGPSPERALGPLLELDEEARRPWAWPLGEQLRGLNHAEAARRAYAAAAARAETPLRERLAAALAGPMVYTDAAQLRAERLRQREALQTLAGALQDAPARGQTLDDLAWSHFPLAYMGEDDTALMRELGRLMQNAAQAVLPQFAEAPACAYPRRVVLVGSVFRDCTAGAYFGGWIDWLRAAGFEVVLYQLGPRRDAETGRMGAAASRFHFIEEATPLNSLAERLHAESAGLILYPELGMDSRLYPLAALRLARRQAMAWGHPVTSGLRSLDAYLSCAEMEPADAAAHYLEPLRLLPGLGVDYRRPPLPPAAARADLGLPERGPLLLAPQSLFKLHPDNDALYAELMRRLPEAQLLFFNDRPAWQEALSQRLQHAGIDSARLHWLPTGSRARYLQINAACDLMLDSRHFSGGNASLDALQAGLPVLTSPGRFMRGRQTAAMLARIGLRERLSVDDPAQLADRAVELIESGEAQALRDSIRGRLPDLFDSESARGAFVEHIQNLSEARVSA
ncbi:Glycosyl transferase family 41 [Aquimonas voraii]|uniref:protein O-GlcNAc transferase n=2 Tax=Aquimonas voraii TaxID=265719 RepID=A0A1G6S3Y0_9GAMM|nr:Glycosyl transferase family 41 [Aquimonas voraii]